MYNYTIILACLYVQILPKVKSTKKNFYLTYARVTTYKKQTFTKKTIKKKMI